MAFMGRGSMPSIGKNNTDNMENNNLGENGHMGHGGPMLYGRYYYYVPLDNTYVIMQMIVTFIILIVGAITLLVTYDSTIVDPIADIKNSFINVYLIAIAIFLVITFIIHFFSKNESDLIKRLSVIFVISIITMLIFMSIKLNLDTTYTRDYFEQFYTESNDNKDNNSKNKVAIGLNGISLTTEKDYYLDECMNLYNIFKIKTYGILGLHILLNILLIYQILRIQKIQNKKDKFGKDDLILYDDEENVKF